MKVRYYVKNKISPTEITMTDCELQEFLSLRPHVWLDDNLRPLNPLNIKSGKFLFKVEDIETIEVIE